MRYFSIAFQQETLNKNKTLNNLFPKASLLKRFNSKHNFEDTKTSLYPRKLSLWLTFLHQTYNNSFKSNIRQINRSFPSYLCLQEFNCVYEK